MKNFWIVFVGAVLLTFSSVSAQQTHATAMGVSNASASSKEAFIAAWEQAHKARPTTQRFEKTDQPGVYDFETSLFPYRGKLKVLNVLIGEKLGYYGDYDLQSKATLTGVAEVVLPGLPENFWKDYPYSSQIWQDQNFLFFIPEANRWMSADDWRAYEKESLSGDRGDCKASPSASFFDRYGELLRVFLPLFIILCVFFFVVRRVQKIQKVQMAKYDLSIDRQARSMEIMEKSLAFQGEQTELLRKLVERSASVSGDPSKK